MKLFLSLLFLIINLISIKVEAFTEKDFGFYYAKWEENKELATKFLEEAENDFRNGDELSGCIAQQEASKLGIKATKYLIQALELKGSQQGIDDIRFGLEKWKEIGKIC